MRAKFHPPARQTEIRTLKGEEALAALAAKAKPWILLDSGVPLSCAPEGRGILRLEGGEGAKRWARLEEILAWLAENKAERSQPLLVIGGGAMLDLGAFAASLYRRGMPLFLAPTTLLGMVDATLGGKTAVDFEQDGRLLKNFAGTFYPAAEIWLCPSFLETLPARERISGAGEVAKTLWIRGGNWKREPLVRYALEGKSGAPLTALAQECLKVKAKVVEKDPLDVKRVREVLNFGHTAGHALESATGLSHGEAVLWGMAIESQLIGAKAMWRETCALIRELGLELPGELSQTIGWETYLSADKKMKGGKLELSLLRAPGKIVRKSFTPAQLAQAIRAFPQSFPREGSNPRG
jgi:3-dehydroquinate synthase